MIDLDNSDPFIYHFKVAKLKEKTRTVTKNKIANPHKHKLTIEQILPAFSKSYEELVYKSGFSLYNLKSGADRIKATIPQKKQNIIDKIPNTRTAVAFGNCRCWGANLLCSW
jgi:hypothetical protein